VALEYGVQSSNFFFEILPTISTEAESARVIRRIKAKIYE